MIIACKKFFKTSTKPTKSSLNTKKSNKIYKIDHITKTTIILNIFFEYIFLILNFFAGSNINAPEIITKIGTAHRVAPSQKFEPHHPGAPIGIFTQPLQETCISTTAIADIILRASK